MYVWAQHLYIENKHEFFFRKKEGGGRMEERKEGKKEEKEGRLLNKIQNRKLYLELTGML